MKTLHILIIVLAVIGIILLPNSFAELKNPFAFKVQNDTKTVEIHDLQVIPSTIKVGNPFAINATLVNYSPNPVFLTYGYCEAPFSVIFDSHVAFKGRSPACVETPIMQKLNSGQKITVTSFGSNLDYDATASGITNATISFSYFVRNQTDPDSSNIGKTISKSFLFMIYDESTSTPNIMLSPLKQFRSGIAAQDISCKEGLFLAIKSHNQEPTCLKAGTISKLASRGFFYGVQANENESNYTTILLPPGSENPSSNKTYSPDVATVVLGVNNTVRWVNQGESAHSISPDMPVTQNGKSIGGFMKPGDSYKFTFTEPGTFPYHGEPGPWEKGTIIVLQFIPINTNHTTIMPKAQDPFVSDKDGKVDLSQIHLPSNKYGQIDYEKIGYLVSENKFKKMLDQLDVKYADDDFLLLEGESFLTYPPFTDYCGYVMDNNKEEHWFSSSFHTDTLTNYKISKHNPEPCKPSFASCFCNLQTKIDENNLKQLSYFTKSEEEMVGETVSQYLNKTEVVNVSNEFTVGKYDLQADPSLNHYCGKFTWGAQLEYFDGYIKDSNVVFFELAPEQQKLCAINSDAKVFSFEYLKNGSGK